MKRKTQTFSIQVYPWFTNGYMPKTAVELSYDAEELELHFISEEQELRAVETENNTDIYCDSCMEMYAQFCPSQDENYINFEINPNGAIYCSRGSTRENCVKIASDRIDAFRGSTRIHKDFWEAWIHIPVAFLKEEFPGYVQEEGVIIRANFYKCGDKTKQPHFGCWKNIEWPEPDFHRPEYFGEIRL